MLTKLQRRNAERVSVDAVKKEIRKAADFSWVVNDEF
jgi:hypothetical protein